MKKSLLKRKCPYHINYWRIVGLRKRGNGRVYIRILPPCLLPPGSKPPPISVQELLQSKILHRVLRRSTVVHSDGAVSYPIVMRKHFKGLRPRAVKHSTMEFVRRIAPTRLKRGSTSPLSGTQSIDSTWKTLDASIPAEVHTKIAHDINPLLEEYMFSWLYRINHRNIDGFQAMVRYMSGCQS